MPTAKTINPRRVIGVLWIGLFVAMLGVGIMSPLLPTYANSLGASGFMLGLIFGGFSLARLVTMPIVGQLSDRNGRKPFIVLGLLMQVLAAFAFILCVEPWQLVATRMFQGIAGAMIIPISMAYVGEISPSGREATYMGWFTFALFIGFGVGPATGGIVKDHFSFTANFILLGSLCFIAFLAVLIFLPEIRPGGDKMKSRSAVNYRQLLANPVLRCLFFFRIANSFGRGVIATFLPLIGESLFGLTTTQVGIVLSANLIMTGLLQPLFGHLADKLGRPALIISGVLVQSACMVIIPWASGFVPLLIVNLIMGTAGAMAIPAASGMITTEGKKAAWAGQWRCSTWA